MRTISLEDCVRVAGGVDESLSCPTGPFESLTATFEMSLPDGSFGGFVIEVLRDINGIVGGQPTSIPANSGELGFRG
jgi:hypothetical protein